MIDPRERQVTVHPPGRPPHHLTRSETLDGAPILDGFRLPVAEIFEQVGPFD